MYLAEECTSHTHNFMEAKTPLIALNWKETEPNTAQADQGYLE